jgi:hypothetical protein
VTVDRGWVGDERCSAARRRLGFVRLWASLVWMMLDGEWARPLGRGWADGKPIYNLSSGLDGKPLSFRHRRVFLQVDWARPDSRVGLQAYWFCSATRPPASGPRAASVYDHLLLSF